MVVAVVGVVVWITIPYDNILKVSSKYLHLLQSYKGRKINLLRARERAEQSREQRERRRIIIHSLPTSHLLGKGCAIIGVYQAGGLNYEGDGISLR